MGTAGTDLAALLLEHPAPDDGDLLHSSAHTMTAGESRSSARSIAVALRDAGLEPGHAVAVSWPNDPRAVVAMFAVWVAGGVFVPLNPRSPAPERQANLDATGARLLLTPSGIVDAGGTRTYADGSAFLLWTSGTTGRPKPIIHTHVAYLELLDRVLGPLRGARSVDDTRRRSPNLIPVSLALNAGIYNVLFGLRAGAEIVIMDAFEPVEFAELVGRFAIRSTVLPPAALTALTDHLEPLDLGPLKYVRSITAALSPLQASRFTARYGVTVLNSYGQAEIGEVIGWTAADAREHPDKVGAAGRPLPNVAIKVVDDQLAPVSAGEPGRLLVRPPSMAAGYAHGADLADRVDAEGYVDTGDHARIDGDGFVWIEGRASDLINRGGNKVFPEQVEEVIRLHPDIDDAAVVGVPDGRLGEVPVAFVVARRPPADAGLDQLGLERLCREHLVAYKVPVRFHAIAALPRTEVGKIRRSDLVAEHARLVGGFGE